MTIPSNIYIEDLSLEDVRIINIILIKKNWWNHGRDRQFQQTFNFTKQKVLIWIIFPTLTKKRLENSYKISGVVVYKQRKNPDAQKHSSQSTDKQRKTKIKKSLILQ